ncbi:MAG: cytochrome c family protein [Planctomycetota bacterium]
MTTRRFIASFALPCAVAALLGASPWLGANSAQDTEKKAAEEKPIPQYNGVKKCKMCHSTPKTGAQYKKWTEGRHSKAFETLGSDAAKKIAAEKGLGDPRKEAACLKCHVAGYGKEKKFYTADYKMEDGVSCEACHGPSSLWDKKELHAGKREEAMKLGMTHPVEATCKTCHNEESPSYKPFDFKTAWEKISHMRPKEAAEGAEKK